MAYIGKEPIVGNFQKCDAITVVNGQAAYTLQVSSTNVVPESANHMLVSLNGILQAPVTSFTVSGSTLTFASNLATGDVIDFVILLGNVLDLGVPSDATVTNAKLATTLLTGATDIGGAIADADLFLLDDGAGGTLRKTAASRIKTYVGSGLSGADQWRITTDYSSNHNANLTANWERNDTSGFGKIGTGLTESSGIFSFPETGYWLLFYGITILCNGDKSHDVHLDYTANNSSYSEVGRCGYGGEVTGTGYTGMQTFLFDITDTSNQKFVLRTSGTSADDYVQGNTSYQHSGITIIRLGDT